ncbi:MAG TPA: hypothetical protein VMB50_18735 [Myxococcales bacterium]|nr:hypothetical protein [Myxococcales bacterium]
MIAANEVIDGAGEGRGSSRDDRLEHGLDLGPYDERPARERPAGTERGLLELKGDRVAEGHPDRERRAGAVPLPDDRGRVEDEGIQG